MWPDWSASAGRRSHRYSLCCGQVGRHIRARPMARVSRGAGASFVRGTYSKQLGGAIMIRMPRLALASLSALAFVSSSAACAQPDHPVVAPSVAVPSDTPEGVVDAFAAALRAGDEAALRRLMAPNVVIAESGDVERSFDEYAAHHMPADFAFTSAMQFTLEQRDTIVDQDMATVISRTQVHGQFHGRPINSNSMETMVLRRIDGKWRIVHIHWSSSPISDGEH
jgi:ketosteroid isomerase-like protein